MKDDKNWLEWAIFVVGCLLTVGMLASLGYQAWTSGATTPQLTVVLGAPEPTPEGVAVPVTVTNEGGQTAENAEVEITAWADGQQVASGTVTLAFVPQNARRKGRVVFAGGVSPENAFTVTVIGYQMP